MAHKNNPQSPTYDEMMGGIDSRFNNLHNGYSHFPIPTMAFIALEKDGRKSENHTGWKIHVSVAVKDLPRAWDLIAPILIRDQVEIAKITKKESAQRFDNPEYKQCGKQITIYHSKNNDLIKTLKDIEEILRKESIKPGPTVKGDHPLAGSNGYLSYRNDGVVNGNKQNYKDASQLGHLKPEERFNPECINDVFGTLSVAPDNKASLESLPRYQKIIAAAGPWFEAETQSGQPIIRIPTNKLTEYQQKDLLHALKAEGFNADLVASKSFGGMSIRLKGNDITKLHQLNEKVIAAAGPWKDQTAGTTVQTTSVSLESLSKDSCRALWGALKSCKFNPEFQNTQNNSASTSKAQQTDQAIMSIEGEENIAHIRAIEERARPSNASQLQQGLASPVAAHNLQRMLPIRV